MFPNPPTSVVVSMYGLETSGSSIERGWYNFRFERRQKGLVIEETRGMGYCVRFDSCLFLRVSVANALVIVDLT